MKRRTLLGAIPAATAAMILPTGAAQTLRAAEDKRAATEASCSIEPIELQAEYLTEPMGLDVAKPRFSWKCRAKDATAYGQKQTAYAIQVWKVLLEQPRQEPTAADATTIRDWNGHPVQKVWSTDWVKSPQMSQIVYEGEPLESNTVYLWMVQLQDEKGRLSNTQTTGFLAGILDPSEWKAAWIGSDQLFDGVGIGIPKGDNNIDDPWLRKTFELAAKPNQSLVHVASIGYHELYVNGKKADDSVLAPCVSDHTKRARYVTYDVGKFLEQGKNVIALWLGTSWSIFGPYITKGSGGAESANLPRTPIVSAQCEIVFGDGKTTQIVTDGSWRTAASSSKLLGSWDFGSFAGELIDENRQNSNWNQANFDDSEWKNATVYEPHIALSAAMCEPNRLFDEIHAVGIEKRDDGSYRVDMGVNFAGWMEMRVHGKPGSRIDFHFSEREQDEMTFRIYSAIIVGADGEGLFKNRFNYHSGRWITVRGLTEEPKLEDFRGWHVRTAYQTAAAFECSDDLQNWINDRVRWTYQNLSIGGYIVDCPQRERLGYGGDAHATSETGLFQYQLGAFYTKWMQDWRDVQGRDSIQANMNDPGARGKPMGGPYLGNGVLPHSAPTYSGGGGPAWGGIVVTLPWSMYQHFGDTRILEENFQMISDWLAFLDTHVEEGVLKRFGAAWDYLADWLWPGATAEGMNNDKIQAVCFNSCYRIFNLETAAKIANVLGKTEMATRWNAQADEARQAIHAKWFDENNCTYCDGSMPCLTAALLANVPPKELRDQAMKRLEKMILVDHDGHIGVGITGGAMLFRLLRAEERNDLLLAMTSKTDYPSWGAMREAGATTIWEMWEKDLPGHSLLHSSYLYPGAWYVDGIAGIKRDPAHPGFQHFMVKPPMLPEGMLSSAKADFASPAGPISVAWERKNGQMTLEVTVPANTSATLCVPKQLKPIHGSAHLAVTQQASGEYACVEAPAGRYLFKTE
ncbi:MAG: family 78 glycoside hydrolase catalytic domain [Thermoguttaceae bacterium]|nr:family 78 glycoside hydrolase catalytic domain [Thermoguttaceae bacterium]